MPAGKKKGQKSAASKKKSTKNKGGGAQRKSNSKSGQPYTGNDLTAKLFATMEKHKDVRTLHHLQQHTGFSSMHADSFVVSGAV